MESNQSPKKDLQSVIDAQIGDTSLEKQENKKPETVVASTQSQPDNLPPLANTNTMPKPQSKPPIIPQKPQEKKEEMPQPSVAAPETPADKVQLNTVRTYKADVNQTVKGDKITTAKVLIAEQKKREKEEAKEDKTSIQNPKNQFKLGFSAVLIGLAIVAILYGTFIFLLPNQTNETVNPIEENNSLIAIDETKLVDVTNRFKNDVLNDVNQFINFGFAEGTLNELVLYEISQNQNDSSNKKVSIGTFFGLFEFTPPYVFSRTLTNDYVFGAYRFENENKPFLLIKLADFEGAYDSAFDYEKDLVFDFKEIFGGFLDYQILDQLLENKNILQKATSTSSATTTDEVLETATTTEEVATSTTPTVESLDEEILKTQNKIKGYENFIDLVLQNSDTRAVLGENSELLFYYTFIDREWLLFANNSEVLKELKRRIREQNLSR